MQKLKTIKVLPSTVKNLNKIAAEMDKKQYEVVELLSDEKLAEIDNRKKKQSKK
jgi:hypothetical protein